MLSQRTPFLRFQRGKYGLTGRYDSSARAAFHQYLGAYRTNAVELAAILRDPSIAEGLIDRRQHARAFEGTQTLSATMLIDLVIQLGLNHVLDLGCGTGGMLLELAKRNPQFEGWGRRLQSLDARGRAAAGKAWRNEAANSIPARRLSRPGDLPSQSHRKTRSNHHGGESGQRILRRWGRFRGRVAGGSEIGLPGADLADCGLLRTPGGQSQALETEHRAARLRPADFGPRHPAAGSRRVEENLSKRGLRAGPRDRGSRILILCACYQALEVRRPSCAGQARPNTVRPVTSSCRCHRTCTARPESAYRTPARRADCCAGARACCEPRRAVFRRVRAQHAS